MKNRILIVDDHLVVRTGISIVLKNHIQNRGILLASDFCETMELLKKYVVDLIILTINAPGTKYFDMIANVRAVQPTVKILIFSAYEEKEYAYRYLVLGVNGYLTKLCSEKKMIQVVTTILEGGNYIPSEIADQIFEAALHKKKLNPLDVLSKRELEVAELLILGNGNLEIANHLKIQMSTVSTFKSRIFEKLKVANIVELINIFKSYAGCN